MDPLDAKQAVRERVERAHQALIGLSHWIHANPELGYEERLAAGWVAEWLEKAGFAVTRGAGGMETALVGTYGAGPLNVALLVEYDALPEVGHACGHNVIAATSVGAGVALAAVADQIGLRVTVIGTPAEEGGAGKQLLLCGRVRGRPLRSHEPSRAERPVAARGSGRTVARRQLHRTDGACRSVP